MTTRDTTPPAASDAASPDAVTGTVDSIIFRSEESGYTVCRLKVPGQVDAVTVVGSCPAIWIGETLRAEGEWVRHRQHGHQFQAASLTCVAPTSARGIERYLASGMIRGIRKVMAERLVRAFGKDTLRVIDDHPERLREVDGIGPTRSKRIIESWVEQKAVRDIMIFLQSHGVGSAQAARIYRHYGRDAVGVISENPYRLCNDIWGIGFKTADGVALSLGVPRESDVRARAGIVYVLQTMTDEGHCFCLQVELILQAQDLLDIPAETLATALERQIERSALVREEEKIYLGPLYEAERDVARRIDLLRRTAHPFRPIAVDKAVPWAERRIGLKLAPKQVAALKMALSEKVSVVTGGPGVGKTTIIRALVDVFRARDLQVCLAAPTGRAAKRMEEATGQEARTIHRMLKYVPTTGHFEHGVDNPLNGDVFILDEVSMMDIALMGHFLAALRKESCLILVGDVDQLPSVGPGNVLRDIIAAQTVACCELEIIFRQEAAGAIVRNAHHVNRGERLEAGDGNQPSDFYFIETREPDDVIARTVDLLTSRIPRRFGLDPMRDIQVLTPMRKNQLGADNLNAVLQEALNPSGEGVSRFGRHYRVGDRVMQIRNNYDKDIFNGDIGRIVKVDPEDQRVAVEIDGRTIGYDFAEIDELVHAYACTIHKSQGSEYPAVIILMTTQHYRLLQRNLLYTALTRGRKLVCLVGSSKAVNMAIRNNEIRLRRTGLRERLQREAEPGAVRNGRAARSTAED